MPVQVQDSLPPKLAEETLSEINSFSFDNFEQSSDSAEEIIIEWFHSHGIEPGDPASIVEAFQAEQKEFTYFNISHRLSSSTKIDPAHVSHSQFLEKRQKSLTQTCNLNE